MNEARLAAMETYALGQFERELIAEVRRLQGELADNDYERRIRRIVHDNIRVANERDGAYIASSHWQHQYEQLEKERDTLKQEAQLAQDEIAARDKEIEKLKEAGRALIPHCHEEQMEGNTGFERAWLAFYKLIKP